MKLFYAVLGALLLSGCGGGGGDSAGGGSGGGTGGGSGGGSTADPLAQYIDIKGKYVGSTAKAPATVETAGYYLDFLLFAAPELMPDNRNIPDFGESCAQGGSIDVQPTNDPNEVTATFKNCKDSGSTLNGVVTGRIKKIDNSGNILEAMYIFQDVAVTAGFGKFTIRGTLQNKIQAGNCTIETDTFNLLFSDTQNNQVLIDNFVFEDIDAYNLNCSDRGLKATGRVFDSEAGFVSYSTPQLFLYIPMPRYGSPEQGKLIIEGSNNSSVVWSVDSYANFDQIISAYKVDIDSNGDGKFEAAYVYPSYVFSSVLLLSFEDADQDGMQDQWELLFGLSPLDPSDASKDADGDGFTNLQEFKFKGHPKNITLVPEVAQLAVYKPEHELSYRYSNKVSVDLPISSNVVSRNIPDAKVVFTVDGPFTLDGRGSCTSLNNGKQLVCPQTFFFRELDAMSIDLVTDPAAVKAVEAHITAEISSSYHDPLPADNKVEFIVSLAAAEPSYLMEVSDADIGKQLNFVGIPGTEMEYRMTVFNPDPAKVEGSVLRIEIPDEVSISSLSVLDLATGVATEHQPTDDLPLLRDQLILIFKLKAEKAGAAQLKFTVGNSLLAQPLNQVFHFPVIVGTSSEVLQLAVDQAVAQSTILVPEGIYIGPLDLSKKQVHLQSELGPENTVLLGTETNERQLITLGQGSDLHQFTIAGLDLQINDAGSIIRGNTFGKPDWLSSGSTIEAPSGLVFKENKILAGFKAAEITGLWSTYGSACVLINTENTSDTLLDVVIENNLYIGADLQNFHENRRCPSFLQFEGKARISFNNNTVFGVNSVLSIEQIYTHSGAAVEINNNIFSTVFSTMWISWWRDANDSRRSLLRNNLYWDYTVDYPGDPAQVDEAGSIFADPELNLTGGLKVTSPAIDAGFELGLSTDVNGLSRPVDGNGDGVAAPDIGAVEFQP